MVFALPAILVSILIIANSSYTNCSNSPQNLLDKFIAAERFKVNIVESGLKHLQAKNVDMMELTEKYRTDLNKFLLSYVDDLRKIKAESEILYEKHNYDSTLKQFKYKNDKDGNPDKIEITYSKEVKVNLNYSFVQVPTEIYRNDVKILNEVKWSKNLDELFKSNLVSNPTLQWQYIGKESGVMRTFPGAK